MIPQRIAPDATAEAICQMAAKWRVDPRVIEAVHRAAKELPFDIQIISGYRTKEEQDALRQEGRPAARDDLSTHRSCPATGVDLYPLGVHPDGPLKATLGAAMSRQGLRWGGGSAVGPDGIPSDWNHFDLGPRNG